MSPIEIVRWAIGQSDGRAIVSTNFRPYEAVLLHLCTQVQPDIPVLWADHGYNRPATYRHAERLAQLLRLNIQAYAPLVTPARYEALYGPVPTPEDETGLKKFSALMKLEPFQRGMRELAHLPALQRAVYCRLLNEKDVERAKPMRVSPGGDGPLFEPIAGRLSVCLIGSAGFRQKGERL